jgi:hypothetical protein
MAARQFRL